MPGLIKSVEPNERLRDREADRVLEVGDARQLLRLRRLFISWHAAYVVQIRQLWGENAPGLTKLVRSNKPLREVDRIFEVGDAREVVRLGVLPPRFEGWARCQDSMRARRAARGGTVCLNGEFKPTFERERGRERKRGSV